MKQYLRCALSVSSILDDVINIFLPLASSTSDTCPKHKVFIKRPIIKTAQQCPNSCNLASILGNLIDKNKQLKLTKSQIIKSMEDKDLKDRIIDRIRYEIMDIKLITSFFLMGICVYLTVNGFINCGILSYIIAFTYTIIQVYRIIEFYRILEKPSTHRI